MYHKNIPFPTFSINLNSENRTRFKYFSSLKKKLLKYVILVRFRILGRYHTCYSLLAFATRTSLVWYVPPSWCINQIDFILYLFLIKCWLARKILGILARKILLEKCHTQSCQSAFFARTSVGETCHTLDYSGSCSDIRMRFEISIFDFLLK